jgi:hypothetical protein
MFSGIKPFVRGLLDAAALLIPTGFVLGMFERYFVYEPWAQVILVSIGFMGAFALAVLNLGPRIIRVLIPPLGSWLSKGRERIQLYHAQKLIDTKRLNTLRKGNTEKARVATKLSVVIEEMRKEVKKKPSPGNILPIQDAAYLTTLPKRSTRRVIANETLQKMLVWWEHKIGIIIIPFTFLHLRISMWAISRIEKMFYKEIAKAKDPEFIKNQKNKWKRSVQEILRRIHLKTIQGLSYKAINKKVKEYARAEGMVSWFHPIRHLQQTFERKRRAKLELAMGVLNETKAEFDTLSALLDNIRRHSTPTTVGSTP